MVDGLKDMRPPTWVTIITGVSIVVIGWIITTALNDGRDIETRANQNTGLITELTRRVTTLEIDIKAITLQPLELRTNLNAAKLAEFDRRIADIETAFKALAGRKTDPVDWFYNDVQTLKRDVERLRDRLHAIENRAGRAPGVDPNHNP